MCVTGSEPLAQAQCFDPPIRRCDRGYAVCLETGGAMEFGRADPRVHRVADVKAPGSGEVERNCRENLALLRA